MKRFLAFTIVFFMLICSGCTQEVYDDESSMEESSSVSDNSQALGGSSVIVEPEKELFGRKIKEGFIEAEYVKRDKDLIDAAMTDEYIIAVYRDNDSDCIAVFYDKYDGSEFRSIRLPDYSFASVGASESGSIIFYNMYGQYMLFRFPEDERPIEEGSFDQEVANDGEAEYVFFDDGRYIKTLNGVITLREIDAEPKVIYDSKGKYSGISFQYENEDGFVFCGFEAENGNVTTFAIKRPYFTYEPMYQDYCVARWAEDRVLINDYYGFVDFARDELSAVEGKVELENTEEGVMLGNSECFFTQLTDRRGRLTVRMYGYDDSIYFRESLELEGASGFYLSDYSIYGNYMLMCLCGYNEDTESNCSTLYIVDTEKQVEKLLRGEELNQNTESDMEKLHEIKILVGDEGIERDFPDFDAVACNDQEIITEALGILEELLGQMPKGFMNELFSDNGSGMNDTEFLIYFVGTITPKVEGTTNFPAAFTYSESNERVLVIDITMEGSLETNLAHEIMHSIDNFIITQPEHEGHDQWSEWDEYLPVGFEYEYSYVDEFGFDYANYEFTPDYGNASEVYFIDAYSKTYPTEDRSRLFENLFTGNDAIFDEYPEITERARYLCEVIRNNFECLDGATDIVWEKTIA